MCPADETGEKRCGYDVLRAASPSRMLSTREILHLSIRNATAILAEIIRERISAISTENQNEILSSMLLSEHNLRFLVRTMQNIRQALEEDRFTEYKREFYSKYDDYEQLLK